MAVWTGQVQLMTLCVSVSLSATVALVSLFGPKLHIIAFQSHKNVRKLTMTTDAGGPPPAAAAATTKSHPPSIASAETATTTPARRTAARARSAGSTDFEPRFAGTARAGCFVYAFL